VLVTHAHYSCRVWYRCAHTFSVLNADRNAGTQVAANGDPMNQSELSWPPVPAHGSSSPIEVGWLQR
jgi:hypothetical protein